MFVETQAADPRGHQRFAIERLGATRAPGITDVAELRAHELIMMAAHDLRAPLAAIKMLVSAMECRRQAGTDPSGAEGTKTLFSILRAVDSGFSLIDEMLTMERLTTMRASTALTREAIDVTSITREAIALEREALKRARCKVTLLREKGLRRARGRWDRGLLLRVFSNLLRNVVRHAPRATVRITLARRRDRLGIVFADNGPGLPRDLETVTAAPEGSENHGPESHGFGLWIVRRAVDGLGGRLSVRTAPGQGVAFDVEIPGLESQAHPTSR
jgi:signal transduction histidine kinase